MGTLACNMRLRKDSGDGVLYLTVEPGTQSVSVSADALRSTIARAECSDWLVDENDLDAAVQRLRAIGAAQARVAAAQAQHAPDPDEILDLDAAPEAPQPQPEWHEVAGEGPLEFVLARRVDAAAVVEVSPDKMKAYVRITASHGGKKADRDMLLQAMKAAGVRKGVREELLDKALAGPPGAQRLLAIGRAPKHGEDSRFQPLISSSSYVGPRIDEKDVADFKEVADFLVVEAGVELMRRYPATKGEPGYTVTGDVLAAKDGKESGFEKKIDGAAPAPEDANLLVSTSGGHPVVGDCGVRVDPTLVVDNVDLSTGNVTFEGSLHVRGEVCDGFAVRVSGDLVVGQNVGHAKVEAGGSVQIAQGCMGGEPGADEEAINYSTEIVSGGDVSCRFASCASIQAVGRVDVQEYLSHCRVEAREVVSGASRGKGIIQGGVIEAILRIQAKVLGSAGNPRTELAAGRAAEADPEFHRLQDHIESCGRRLEKVADAYKLVGRKIKQGGGLNPELESQLQKLNFTKTYLEDLISSAEADIEALDSGTEEGEVLIEASGRVYPNVFLRIFGARLRVAEERGKTVYRYKDGEIQAG